MRAIILFIGLCVMLSWYLPLSAFYGLLPAEMFVYPRRTISNQQYTTIAVLIQWVLPAVVVATFMWRSKVATRVNAGWGLTLFTVGVVIFVALWASKYLAALVPGGGGLYTVNALAGYLGVPLKALLLVGAVQILIDLKLRPRANPSFEPTAPR